MINIFLQSFFKERLHFFPSRWTYLSALFNELIFLTVIWYTAKAFVPNVKVLGDETMNYFKFVVIGEMTLRLPALAILSFTRLIKTSSIDGTLDQLILLPSHLSKVLSIHTLSTLAMEVIKLVIILIICHLFFKIDFTLAQYTLVVIYQLTALPIFMGLGLISASLFLWLGRGEGIIYRLITLLTIFAGVYFPTSLFPDIVEKLNYSLSPLTFLLTETRTIFSQGPYYIQNYLFNNLFLLLTGIIFLVMGHYTLNWALDSYRRRGRPFIFITN